MRRSVEAANGGVEMQCVLDHSDGVGQIMSVVPRPNDKKKVVGERPLGGTTN